MGLAGPKKNTKISNDPRNTHWASNTDRFGHRMLKSYGWEPGGTLGNTKAAHHEHITSASHSGIKVMLKDDNLGIGAKKGSKDDECTGLDVFQDLLGRLNGKSEGEIVKAAQIREKQKQATFIEQRYRMRFVLGEVYVSTDIDKLIEAGGRTKSCFEGGNGKRITVEPEEAITDEIGKPRKRKKDDITKSEEEGKSLKGGKWRKGRKKDEVRKHKKKRKLGQKESVGETVSPTPPMVNSLPKEDNYLIEGEHSQSDSERRKTNKEKRRRKKDKKIKEKEDKKRQNGNNRTASSSEPDAPQEKKPANSAILSKPILSGRHAIRARYIAAKKSAVMDKKALNEIFMLKGGS